MVCRMKLAARAVSGVVLGGAVLYIYLSSRRTVGAFAAGS